MNEARTTIGVVASGLWPVAGYQARTCGAVRSLRHRPTVYSLQPTVSRRGFTLVELLITIAIIAIMASMILFALFSAQEAAKAQKTRALVAKLSNIVMAKYESYKTRRVALPAVQNEPFTDSPAGPLANGVYDQGEAFTDTNGNNRWDYSAISWGKMKLDCLRDLMRMEMPDRWSDVTDDPVTPFETTQKIARPSVSQGFLRRYTASAPDPQNENAECLYLWVTKSQQDDGDGRDAIKPDNIGDVDGDGYQEFIDGWGKPVRFIRWPAGFPSELSTIAKFHVVDAVGGRPDPLVLTEGSDPNNPGLRLADSGGQYIGGSIAVTEPDGAVRSNSVAKITGYNKSGGVGIVMCDVPEWSAQNAFVSTPADVGDTPVILAADPFDPMGVYPIYPRGSLSNPDVSFRTWAIYPLVYSAGPDKEYGIYSDLPTPSNPDMHYADVGMNPFYIGPTGLIGNPTQSTPLPNEKSASAWRDNIHNHVQNFK